MVPGPTRHKLSHSLININNLKIIQPILWFKPSLFRVKIIFQLQDEYPLTTLQFHNYRENTFSSFLSLQFEHRIFTLMSFNQMFYLIIKSLLNFQQFDTKNSSISIIFTKIQCLEKLAISGKKCNFKILPCFHPKIGEINYVYQ